MLFQSPDKVFLTLDSVFLCYQFNGIYIHDYNANNRWCTLYRVPLDVENIVATTVTLDNPSEDGTCHNFNSVMFEVCQAILRLTD